MRCLSAVCLLLALSCLSVLPATAQRKVINYTEAGALIHVTNSLADGSSFSAFRTRTGMTRIISEHYGLGIALGTDNYRKRNAGSYNTLPITANAAYFFNPDLHGLKADVYAGYAVRLFNNFNRGLTAGAGLSYSVPVNAGLNLGLQTGYNYQEIDFPNSFITQDFNIGTFRLGLGITFK